MQAQGQAASQIGAMMGDLTAITHQASDSITETKHATADVIRSVETLETKVGRFRLDEARAIDRVSQPPDSPPASLVVAEVQS